MKLYIFIYSFISCTKLIWYFAKALNNEATATVFNNVIQILCQLLQAPYNIQFSRHGEKTMANLRSI